MVQMNINGQYVNLVDESELKWRVDAYFDEMFTNYLRREFCIDKETFKQIIKEAGAEHFV